MTRTIATTRGGGGDLSTLQCHTDALPPYAFHTTPLGHVIEALGPCGIHHVTVHQQTLCGSSTHRHLHRAQGRI